MRTTGDYALLHLPNRATALALLARPEFLTTARYEAVFRERLGSASLDLVFECGEDILVIHGVAVDMTALASLAGPSLLWPARCAIDAAAASAVEELVYPWLRTLVRGRSAYGESIRTYRDSATFERARALGLRGAAPFAQTLVAAAPFVYARRFAHGARVRIACADAYHAAAVLGDIAAAVHVVAPPGADAAFARRWYGDRSAPDAGGAPDLAIIDDLDDPHARGAAYAVATRAKAGEPVVVVPEPIPNDHLFTFDPADAPEAARFAVRAADRAVRAPRDFSPIPALGGSSGTICIVLRDDAAYAPDAQADEANALAARLRAEGLRVDVVTDAGDERLARADLVHVFGAAGSVALEAPVAAARRAGRPFVLSLEPLTPLQAASAEDALLAMLQLGCDRAQHELYRAAYARGALQIDGIATASPDELARRDRRFGAACAGATAVLLAAHDDPAAFRARFPEFSAESVRAARIVLAPEPAEDPVAHVLPNRPFLLMHAPFVRRSNLPLVLAALAETPLATVVAGPVSDVDLAITLRRIAGPDVVFLPDPPEGVVAALYRRAAAFAEPSRRPAGLARIVRAAQAGALPLVPHDSPLAPLLDAGSLLDTTTFERLAASVTATLARGDVAAGAARAAARLRASADQRAAFGDVLAAYALAQAPA